MRKRVFDEVEDTNKQRLSRYSRRDPLEIIYAELPEEQKQAFIIYREMWQSVDRERIDIPFPLNIYIEPVSDCNLSCSFCIRSRKNWKKLAPQVFSKKKLGFERFKRIIDEGVSYGLPAIWVGASGEALLEKDIPKMLQYAHDRGIVDNILITNGTLLTTKIIDHLLDIPLTRLNISIDAFSEDTYRKLRGGDYGKLVRNLDYLLRMKKKRKLALPVLRVTFVELEANAHEKKAFLDYWSARVESVDIQRYHNFDLSDKPEEKERDIKCSFPWRSVMVLADGNVLPCCSFYAAREHVMGNIDSSNIRTIWDSESFCSLRKNIKKGNYADACKVCFDSHH
jgi:radical SAM protein with 4Fe4S-binding SPASM domain